MTPKGPTFNPYAQPLSRRALVLCTVIGVTVMAMVAAAVTAERWLPERRWIKVSLATFLASYQELYLAGLPGDDAPEYVVFLSGNPGAARDAALSRFFSTQDRVRLEREAVLPDTLVVTLSTDPREALSLLREQPFVRLAVRNQGLFFCH